ncbi:polar amino acid transport system permease protein [Bradyrhizobium sp. LM6.10]
MSLWFFLEQYGSRYLSGSLVTASQFVLASLVTVVLAVTFGLLLLSKNHWLRAFAAAYIEFFRGSSLVVQIYWIFFVLPLLGLSLSPFTAGFLAVGLNTGAYGAEVVRGAILAVPKGQWEAAYALSMSPAKLMYRIIFPQAFLIMLPPWGNLLIDVLKGTALVSLIGLAELMFQAKQINNLTFLSAQAFGAALAIYYLLARFLITPAVRGLESRLRRKMSRT